MGVWYNRETFFRPDEVSRHSWPMSAEVYNRCHLLLAGSETGCVFVPIRSMQYVAVIDPDEIVFVDGQGGYIVSGGDGGRPIALAWQFPENRQRESLSEALGCEVIHYQRGLADIQRRLVGEFSRALCEVERKYRQRSIPAQGARILPLNPR